MYRPEYDRLSPRRSKPEALAIPAKPHIEAPSTSIGPSFSCPKRIPLSYDNIPWSDPEQFTIETISHILPLEEADPTQSVCDKLIPEACTSEVFMSSDSSDSLFESDRPDAPLSTGPTHSPFTTSTTKAAAAVDLSTGLATPKSVSETVQATFPRRTIPIELRGPGTDALFRGNITQTIFDDVLETILGLLDIDFTEDLPELRIALLQPPVGLDQEWHCVTTRKEDAYDAVKKIASIAREKLLPGQRTAGLVFEIDEVLPPLGIM